MAVPFLSGIDLSQTELLNAVLQNLATAPGTPVAGQVWYDTAASKIKAREGGANVSFALDTHDHDADYAAAAHTHDGRYYTETEVDTLLSGKSDTTHTHDLWDGTDHDAHDHSAALASAALFDLGDAGGPAPGDGNALLWSVTNGRWEAGDVSAGSHNHDATYYTETEVDSLLAGKSDTGHAHAAGDVTSGTFANARIAQSNVTQHQAALSITESQISNLDHLTLEEVQDDLGLTSLLAGTSLTKVYDDVAGTITLNVDSGDFATSAHNHDTAYVNEADHTKTAHDAMGIDAATVGGSAETDLLARINHTGTQALSTITGHDKAAHDALNIDAETLDGNDSTAFEFVANKGVANGYASLDAGAKVPAAQLPALALTETLVVASIAERDALTVEEGDVAIVIGNSTSYIYDGTAWQELVSPTDGVQSVTGGTGITSSGGTNPSISITAGGVDSTQLADGAVINAKLGSNAVSQAKMGTNSVGTAELIDGNVTEAKLGFTRVKRVAGAIGDGVATAYTITHGLGTRDVVIMVYRNSSPYDVIFCDVEQTSTTQATLRFASAPSTNEFRYVVVA